MNNRSAIGQTILGLSISALVLLAGVLAIADYRAQFLATIGLGDDAMQMQAETFSAGNFRIRVQINPLRPRVGRNKLSITIKDGDGMPVNDAKVRAIAEMPAMGSMPAMRAAADIKQLAPGEYAGEIELEMAGEWPLAVDVEKAGMGHADLIFDMATGRKGLTSTASTPAGISHYTCSMHPSVKSTTPGTCPICSMGLVAVTKAEVSSGAILVDEGRRQRIGVKTGVVEWRPLHQTIRAVGEITVDSSRLSDVSLRYKGWIGKLDANYIGQDIRRGQRLFTVYGPQMLAAQVEYLESKRQGRNKALINAAKRRLSLWDMNPSQIKALEKRGKAYEYLPFYAPASGTIIYKDVVEGAGVMPGKTLLRIADLGRVWLEVSIYEYELSLVSIGMPVAIELPDLPNQLLKGKVSWLDPIINAKTRSGKIRIQLDNHARKLKPGMFANVRLERSLGKRLVVPEQAVLFAGDTRVVFLDLGEGRLAPRRIKVGLRNDDWIEVLDGLQVHDKVVTSGNFLIAAESKLKSGINQW